MQQLPIATKLLKNIEYHYYEAGHMIYIEPRAHAQLHDNVAQFIHRSASATSGN
jgi:carboxypeptidase C (cathepsin A)